MKYDFHKKRKITELDLSPFSPIGDGKDGKIYKLSQKKCVKYYFHEETQQKELQALQTGQSSPIFPRLYEYGDNYIVMEYVQGISLARYLKHNRTMNKELTLKILNVLEELKRVGFNRWDTEVRHMLINIKGEFKVIDHKRAFSTTTTVPKKLFKGIRKFGLMEEFLTHVKTLKPSLYKEWKDKV
ncbi:kinase [Bacillus spongiae]|uniref:Kinase n=1 Tax=Bacillus spongiae TaxID=2683610 RepID=A0ABU8HJJ1_9BACI